MEIGEVNEIKIEVSAGYLVGSHKNIAHYLYHNLKNVVRIFWLLNAKPEHSRS
jgi:hypothetical protein